MTVAQISARTDVWLYSEPVNFRETVPHHFDAFTEIFPERIDIRYVYVNSLGLWTRSITRRERLWYAQPSNIGFDVGRAGTSGLAQMQNYLNQAAELMAEHQTADFVAATNGETNGQEE